MKAKDTHGPVSYGNQSGEVQKLPGKGGCSGLTRAGNEQFVPRLTQHEPCSCHPFSGQLEAALRDCETPRPETPAFLEYAASVKTAGCQTEESR